LKTDIVGRSKVPADFLTQVQAIFVLCVFRQMLLKTGIVNGRAAAMVQAPSGASSNKNLTSAHFSCTEIESCCIGAAMPG